MSLNYKDRTNTKYNEKTFDFSSETLPIFEDCYAEVCVFTDSNNILEFTTEYDNFENDSKITITWTI